jgi:hypothetical protein
MARRADRLLTTATVICVALAVVVRGQVPGYGSALIGSWTGGALSGRPATLTFSAGGFFEIEFQGDETIDVFGRYQVAGNELRVVDENGFAACSEREFGEGRYSFRIRGGELVLDAIEDRCDGRAAILQRRVAPKRAWTRKP